MLGLLIWREARGESITTQYQVGHTVKNRLENPSWWGKTWIEVITKKWQYSSLTDPRDKQLTRWPNGLDDNKFGQCLQIAYNIYFGNAVVPFPEADSYYDDSIKPPKWATPAKRLGKLDHIVFYNIDGSTGD